MSPEQPEQPDPQRTVTIAGAKAIDPERTMTLGGTQDASATPQDQGQLTIARYRVVSLIGEGGMGAVYEAEQDQPRRTVALKVIKAGMANPAMLKRFEQEALALGRLQHPGIAQIYEAGSAESQYGPQPYFAMEFIRGRGLRDYAEARKLTTEQRLELMAKISDAVQHAHQRGLIHRDLKPANILVDETGQPKILDFGVARLTDRDAQATSQTDVGQLIGTLAYMSPEQVLADPMELDTRSDVYALGVILYELLSGQLPYNIGTKLHEALQAIRDAEPTPLGSVNRAFRGDIETIAAKALEKDKARRYASAAELGADIRRYLADEPVMARPPSISYQVQKFARKNKVLVGGALAVLLALIGGIAASTWEAARANRAEHAAVTQMDRAVSAEKVAMEDRNRAIDAETQARKDRDEAMEQKQRAMEEKKRADSEAAIATAVSEFMQKNLFEQASGSRTDISVRAALDRASGKIAGQYDKKPLVEAGVRDAIASAYMTLGAFPEAVGQAERAYEIRRKIQGEEDPATLNSMTTLGSISLAAGRPNANALITKLYRVRQRTLGEEHEDTLKAKLLLGALAMRDRKFEEAQSILTATAETARKKLGPDHDVTKGAQQILAAVTTVVAQTKATSRTEVARLTADLAKTVESVDKSSIPQATGVIALQAQTLMAQGNLQQAEELFLRGIELTRGVGVEDANLLRGIANLYINQRKDREAEPYLVSLVTLDLRANNGNDQQSRFDMGNLSRVYIRLGKYAESETVTEKLYEAQIKFVGADNLSTPVSAVNIAWLRWKQRENAEAESTLRPALASIEKLAANSWEKFSAQALLAAVLNDEPKLEVAVGEMSSRRPTQNVGQSFFTTNEAKAALEQLKKR
jgi:non-specific serine/threonine protein kinase/serine/threonine-protein kinase